VPLLPFRRQIAFALPADERVILRAAHIVDQLSFPQVGGCMLWGFVLRSGELQDDEKGLSLKISKASL
jgi:hypothetical protein